MNDATETAVVRDDACGPHAVSRERGRRPAHAADRRYREGHGTRALHRGSSIRRSAGRPHPEKSGRARPDPRHRHDGRAGDPRRARRRHRGGFRGSVWRDPHRAERVAASPRQSPLSRRAVGCGGGDRRGQRAKRRSPRSCSTSSHLPAYFQAADARAADAVPLHENKAGNIEREVDQVVRRRRRRASPPPILCCEQTFHYAEVAHGQIELNAAVAALRARARPPHDAFGDAGPVLPASHARSLPRHGRLAHPSGEALRRRRFRTSGRAAQLRDGHGALLARAAGGTVKMELSREECFLTHRGRPETDIRLKLGLKKTGEITAVDCEIVQRGGAYGGYGLVTILYAGALLHALYKVPAVKYRGYRVYTNTPPCGAMRGHGAVDARHAFESLLDIMAGGARPRSVRDTARQPASRPRTGRSTTCRSTRTGSPRASIGSSRLPAGRSAAASCRAGAASGSRARTMCPDRRNRCIGAASRMR